MATRPYRFNLSNNYTDINIFINEFKERVLNKLKYSEFGDFGENYKSPFISFAEKKVCVTDDVWLRDNEERFFEQTTNEKIHKFYYLSDLGFIFCMLYSPDGEYIIVGYSTGLVQMHHGRTGAVMCTLRSVQFPPKPIYALEFHPTEDRVCYAACMDGAIYRIDIPFIPELGEDEINYGIKANPGLDCLNMQFYGAPGPSASSTPFVTQRSPALSLGITANSANLVVGFGDASIKVFDMKTQAVNNLSLNTVRCGFLELEHPVLILYGENREEFPVPGLSLYRKRVPGAKPIGIPWSYLVCYYTKTCFNGRFNCLSLEHACFQATQTYKVHKLRIQYIPKKLQRMHAGQVCALKCHDERPFVFASAAWDNTVRRNFCIVGSWQTTEALTVWDIIAKKKVSIVRVQNRRPDVDGEYIYACRYWNSHKYNRKAKYGIIGGSGTNCVEVINLHNRYITCSYPAEGTVLAVTSHEDLIAFGGTASVFSIVSFHDPKHEEYPKDISMEYNYKKEDDVVLYEGDNESMASIETDISQVPDI